eukprot:Gregarina_sp_Pseudo_9__77@NODE_1051_length_1929_cov_19_898413_g984_i0_p1_GENE_NODE_1051_length_1929_cov_19_898413_g984_i0NODE_1051_length_1929_cov_19_898413_g984_i0_p1_ORF_typecomplete_len332_score101_96Branch/PF02485_21/3_1e12_NODE_1051_length_1929_cov_19_898413_g984_i06581653
MVWEEWFQDARDFLLQQSWIEANVTTKDNPYLQAVMTYPPDHAEAVSALSLPDWLQLDSEPVWGEWGKLLGVMHRGLELALSRHPNASYFILSSDTTVPVKSYQYILGEISVDPRSRFDIFCHNFWIYFFKHSQWIMLSREHTQWLVEAADWWTQPHVRWVKGREHCVPTVAATDEYFPGKALIVRGGGLGATHAINARLAMDRNKLNGWTFIYWPTVNESRHLPFGVVAADKHGHPARFVSLTSTFLRRMVQKEGLWFLRKTTDDANVTDCSKSLEAYYAELMLGAEPTAPNEQDTCLLRDFLPLLWKRERRGHVQIKARGTDEVNDAID